MTILSPKNHYALRFRRLGISGSIITSPAMQSFCQIFGQRLAQEPGLILVTGGFHHFQDQPDVPSVPWTVVKSASEIFHKEKIPIESRIETLLPGIEKDKIARFKEGRVYTLTQKSSQARRFVWVNTVDLLVTIGGDDNTKEMIDLALALEKPCLPLCFTGSISQDMWQANRDTIQELLNLETAEVEKLEKVVLAKMSARELKGLAEFLISLIKRKLKPRCLVIMPFSQQFLPIYEEAIKPAITDAGLDPIRVDHLNLVGNAISALRDALHTCDYILADLTGFNPNVLYELGFSHAQKKVSVLLCKYKADGNLPDLPFDLRSEYVISYGNDLYALRSAVQNALLHAGK